MAKAYRLLKATPNTAIADEVLARNPCVVRGGGAERTPERVPPTLVEARALAEAIEPPETDAGRRSVYLPPHLVPELLAHLDRCVGPGADATARSAGKISPG